METVSGKATEGPFHCRIRNSRPTGCSFEYFAWTYTTAPVKMGFGPFGVSSAESFLTP
jgi:hypothetical protein